MVIPSDLGIRILKPGDLRRSTSHPRVLFQDLQRGLSINDEIFQALRGCRDSDTGDLLRANFHFHFTGVINEDTCSQSKPTRQIKADSETDHILYW